MIVIANNPFNSVAYFVAFDWGYALLDTSSMVHFRSTPLFVPADLLDRILPNAQYHCSSQQHLWVV